MNDMINIEVGLKNTGIQGLQAVIVYFFPGPESLTVASFVQAQCTVCQRQVIVVSPSWQIMLLFLTQSKPHLRQLDLNGGRHFRLDVQSSPRVGLMRCKVDGAIDSPSVWLEPSLGVCVDGIEGWKGVVPHLMNIFDKD